MSSFQACYHYLLPLLVAGLAGCQLLGWDSEPQQPRQAALRGGAQETLDYPSLHTVPPRPQLSYSVEQRRDIVERLVNDRAYARYTDQRVRFESGLSSLPPPPEPPPAAAEAAAERVVGASSQTPADEPDQASVEQGATATDYDTFDDAARTDDGTLSDFMRDLVRDTAPPSPAPEEPAPPDEAAAPTPEQDAGSEEGAPAPPASEAAGTIEPQALLAWIGGLFGGEESSAPAASPAAAMAPSPSKPALPARAEVAAVAAPLPPPSKPASAVSPPGPGPAKPVLARGPAPGDLATISFSPGSATLAAGVDALLERAWTVAAGAPIELHARGGGHALAADRARAVALALFRMGAMPGDLELLVSGTGPGEVHVLAATGSS